MPTINDRALLASLSISQWAARKLDKKASKEVADNNYADTSAGRYNKSLLPLNDPLANVHQKTGVIRDKFAKNTLPWGIDGTRILPSANYMDFMQDFRAEKAEWLALVSTFLAGYEHLAFVEAPRYLGKLYDTKDYPEKSKVAGKFRIDMAIMPVPENDFRVSLSHDEMTRLQEDMETRMASIQQEAMADCWNRLYKHVEHIAEQLSKPTGRIYDSLIENTQETCSLLTKLNLTGDPNLEAMRQMVEGRLTTVHPDTLRNDMDARLDTAEEARKIMDAMGAFMGNMGE